jgi:hypothetical protein
MRVKIAIAAVLAVALAGCETTVPGGTAPFVSDDAAKWQSKVTHAVNWQELADRAVAGLPTWPEKFPVFVETGPYMDPNSPFAAVYGQFLQEALLRANYPVVRTRADARIKIGFDLHPLVYPELVPVGHDTSAEIVVSTRIEDEHHVHYLRTETVYVKPSDLNFYYTPPPPPPEEVGLPVATLPVHAVSH